MKHKHVKVLGCVLSAVLLAGGTGSMGVHAEDRGHWEEADGAWYWYENGVKQGTEGRGKEIYDPSSDAWYWLDAIDGGKKATDKDVYMEYEDGTGKWVRYDTEGRMVKGWSDADGKRWYFDLETGAMAKGAVEIDGTSYYFDMGNGQLRDGNGWEEVNGVLYWYESGVKQGTEGRGKEIYDPSSDAWYWLDAIDGGKKAAGKDVYMEYEDGTGKWVRYDAEGRMVKGWNEQNGNRYYFDPETGAMAKGRVEIDGVPYSFDEGTGILQDKNGWEEVDGAWYWYENGVRQGTEGRGKEIYDPGSDAWYWLDAVDGGKKATGKDVYMEYADGTGKWVRYDAEGRMVKGWNEQNGNRYYFDPTTGAMAKGVVNIDGTWWNFDTGSGICQGEAQVDTRLAWHVTKGTTKNANGTIAEWTDYSYDADGHTTRRITYEGEGTKYPFSDYEYVYENGVRIRQIHHSYSVHSQNGKPVSSSLNFISTDEYNNGQRTASEYIYYTEGKVNYRRRSTYDQKGNQQTYRRYDSAGNLTQEEDYEYRYDYHEKGDVTQHKYTSYDGEKVTSYVDYYEYDNNGNLIKTYRLAEGGKETSRNEYTYDEHGNRVEMVQYGRRYDSATSNYSYMQTSRHTYTYDSNRNLMEDKYYYWSYNGSVYEWSLRGRTVYAYDTNGNKIEQTSYNISGQEEKKSNRYTYTYDEHGNQTEEKYYLYGSNGEEQVNRIIRNGYMVIGNNRYTMSYESENTPNDKVGLGYNYGYVYERTDTGAIRKYTRYTHDTNYKKIVDYYQVYESYSLPALEEVGQHYEVVYYKTYNADDTLRSTYESEYTSYLYKNVH